MCGIVGIVGLGSERPVDRAALARMTRSLEHRGPDEEGSFAAPSLGLGSSRLSIVGIEDGQQPVYNEDGSVVAVFNGELFDYPELRTSLAARGHRLRSHTDSELIVHLWEESGEQMFEGMRGQFAFALADLRKRRLILGRDRMGICPLHWSRQGDWFVFGSEIKALFSSGLVPREPDPKGLDNIFTFFCMPGRRTAFRGVSAVAPGCYLRVDFANRSIEEKRYWDFDFPDCGQETQPTASLVSAFDEILEEAVRRRLRADVPVAAYLSGGVDSNLIVAMCRRVSDARLATFTARTSEASLDESSVAARSARDLGCDSEAVDCAPQRLAEVYPAVVTAADCPVVDPNAGSLWELSRAVHRAGYKVVLTGEGADEALAGYVWFKAHRLIRGIGWGGFRPVASVLERMYHREFAAAPPGEFRRINALLGGLHAQTLVYHLTSFPRWRLLRNDFRREIGTEGAWDQLDFDTGRIRRWHPLNQSLYLGYKTQLPGLLLNHRGDRVAMANSVETRYPFLDEALVDFCCRIGPQWKLRGLLGDKYLLRITARRCLPESIAMRHKAMFRAPFGGTLLNNAVPYVSQLLSPESLRRTAYFDRARVAEFSARLQSGNAFHPFRFFFEMALCAVVGTQLWHHLFLGGGLCELPAWEPPAVS